MKGLFLTTGGGGGTSKTKAKAKAKAPAKKTPAKKAGKVTSKVVKKK